MRDYPEMEWESATLVAVLPDNAEERYLCVGFFDQKRYANGEKYECVGWSEMRETCPVETMSVPDAETKLSELMGRAIEIEI